MTVGKIIKGHCVPVVDVLILFPIYGFLTHGEQKVRCLLPATLWLSVIVTGLGHQ